MNYLNPEGDIRQSGDSLPHWQQEAVTQFVTFRLADSLPKSLIEEWSSERDHWLADHPKPWCHQTCWSFTENLEVVWIGGSIKGWAIALWKTLRDASN